MKMYERGLSGAFVRNNLAGSTPEPLVIVISSEAKDLCIRKGSTEVLRVAQDDKPRVYIAN